MRKRYPAWVYGLILLLVLLTGFIYRACYERAPPISARVARSAKSHGERAHAIGGFSWVTCRAAPDNILCSRGAVLVA